MLKKLAVKLLIKKHKRSSLAFKEMMSNLASQKKIKNKNKSSDLDHKLKRRSLKTIRAWEAEVEWKTRMSFSFG